jgi:putative SOS response-associated peptidase YedK
MCGRVVQASGPDLLGLRIVNSFEGRDRRGGNLPPRYNAAPSQELWAIRQHPDTGERTLDLLRWGLIPYWMKAKPKPPPTNAKAETVAKLPCSATTTGSAGASCRSTRSSSGRPCSARR